MPDKIAVEPSIDTLVAELWRWRERLITCSFSDGKDSPVMEQFIGFISALRDEETLSLLLSAEDFPSLQAFFSDRYLQYIARLEELETATLLAKSGQPRATFMDIFATEFGRLSYQRVLEIFALVDMSTVGTFVMVGSGALPTCILAVNDHTEIPRIVGIDVHCKALARAQEIVSAYSLDRIALTNCNAIDYDYSKADAIYVANLVKPKKQILERIAQTAAAHVPVIVREPFLMGNLFAERTQTEINHALTAIPEDKAQQRFLSMHRILQARQ